MEISINTRKHGKITFTANNGDGYVSVHGLESTPRQICDGGKLHGSTISCTDAALPLVARKWWAAYSQRKRNR